MKGPTSKGELGEGPSLPVKAKECDGGSEKEPTTGTNKTEANIEQESSTLRQGVTTAVNKTAEPTTAKSARKRTREVR